MENKDGIFSSWPVWLRWALSPVLFIGVYFIAFFLISLLFPLLISFTITRESIQGLVLINVSSAGAALVSAYRILPKRKMLISGVMSLLLSVLHLIAFLGEMIAIVKDNNMTIAMLICTVLLGIAAVLMIRGSRQDEVEDALGPN